MKLPTQDPLPYLLILLALVFYLPGVNWGFPSANGPERMHAWGNDDQVPLAPLAEMHNTFVEAKPDRNVAYPWFPYFLISCAYGPYLVYLFATGALANPTDAYPFGLSDPVTVMHTLTWIGRSVTLILALCLVLGAYYIGRILWGRGAGFITALLVMLMYPVSYYAKLGNPDVPVLAWTCMALAVFALCLRRGLTPSRGLWFATFTALATASKDQSAGSLALLPLVLFVLHFRSGKKHELWKWTGRWTAPLATSITFLVVYVLASGIPVDPTRYRQHLEKVFMLTGKAWFLRYPPTFDGYVHQARDMAGFVIDVLSWPVLLCAIAGIVLALLRDRLSLTLLLSSLGFSLMLVPVGMARIHYLLPVALPLTAFAGYALWELGRRSAPGRMLATAATVAILFIPVLRAVGLNYEMINDSRYAAGEWFREHASPGDSLVYFGFSMKLPPLSKDVDAIGVFHSADAVPTIEQQRPEFFVVIPQDLNEKRQRVEWRHGPNSVISPLFQQDWEALNSGTLEYRLVAKFQTPRLFPWLDRPFLTYPTVNPPIQIFARQDVLADAPALEPWLTAPEYSRFIRVTELTADIIDGDSASHSVASLPAKTGGPSSK